MEAAVFIRMAGYGIGPGCIFTFAVADADNGSTYEGGSVYRSIVIALVAIVVSSSSHCRSSPPSRKPRRLQSRRVTSETG